MPIMVLASSLAIVILLCLGLIRIKVEMRPEKLCHSFYIEKVFYFDSFEHPFVSYLSFSGFNKVDITVWELFLMG
jgi:hypothetical protein